MSPRRRPVRLLAALALVAGAAGCNGDGGGGGGAAPATTAVTEQAERTNTVTIGMREYAFDVSGSVEAGTTTVVMENSGQELHMTGFGLLREGKGLDDVRAALASEDEGAFDDVFAKQLDAPGGLLSPGRTMAVTTPFLQAGTYALMCFVPTVGEAVPHTAKGMLGALEVAEGHVEMSPGADARYAIADGTIDGPTRLDAGQVTIEMTSAGAGPHEFLVARKREPATTFEQIDDAFTALFEAELPPAPGYADALPAVIAGNAVDVAAGSTIFMTLDLEPGRYLVGCARDPDDAGTEAHAGELLEVEVT